MSYITQGTRKYVRLLEGFRIIGVRDAGASVTKIHRDFYGPGDFHSTIGVFELQEFELQEFELRSSQ